MRIPSRSGRCCGKNGYPIEEDSLIVQREISAEGGSTVRIDGRPATVALLRDIGQNLINIHGQHDNQILLSAERHLSIIDTFGELEPMAREYREEFEKLRTLLRQMKSLSVGEDEIKDGQKLLRLEIEEIEKARLSPRLEEMLTERRDSCGKAKRLRGRLAKPAVRWRG